MMMIRLLLLTGLLISAPGARAAGTGDSTSGAFIFSFLGGGCGLSEHDAPSGIFPNVDVREFYRWNVTCLSTTGGGYASGGWPATGVRNDAKYLAFQIIPTPGYEVRIPVNGFGFLVKGDGGGPDSLDVVLQTAYRPLRTLLTAQVTGQWTSVMGPATELAVDGPTLVRIHAWRSDSVPGGIASGGLVIDDVTMSFRVVARSATSAPEGPAPDVPRLALSAYPNPFNPSTQIRYRVPEAGEVRLSVYDALGRPVARVVDGPMPAGDHLVTWNAATLPSGMYVVRLEDDAGSATVRLLLYR